MLSAITGDPQHRVDINSRRSIVAIVYLAVVGPCVFILQPGFVQGLYGVHEELCRLPMSRLAEPAVRAARDGVTMTDFHAYLFTIVAPILTASAEAKRFFAPEGKLLEGGQTYRNPDFAETLEWLAEDGPRLFTEGDAARAMGGTVTVVSADKRDVESLSSKIERSISHVPAGEGQQWKDQGYYLLLILALVMLSFFRRGGSVAIE